MRMTMSFSPTLRETPAEAELKSHKLMLRAGLMRKAAAGMYTFLPLGYRVVKKVMNIIREEMDRAGAQEVLMPMVQSAEIWQQTGRWESIGHEMFRLKDRHGRDFCLGPTHEELITTLVRADVNSYRQLPLRLYQVQNKYRDEIRPRFGLMRGREFIMKDCYSFDKDEAGLKVSYDEMYAAYSRIFSRLGLVFRAVEADTGAIGGDSSHEFMVLADSGEDEIVYCPSCDYAANVEKARGVVLEKKEEGELLPLTLVDTPHRCSVEEVSSFLQVHPSTLIKTMIYLADGKPIAALLRGDHELQETKLRNRVQCSELVLADAETIARVTKSPVGYAGPMGLALPVFADLHVKEMKNAVTGANEEGKHFIGVNLERDYQVQEFLDLKTVGAMDPCPVPLCSGLLESARGIEVGHIFKLGTKYSKALKAFFLPETGKEIPLIMGCYGIGVGRSVAAIIEQHCDDKGISWPVEVAPYSVCITPVSYKDEVQKETAEKLYADLQKKGVEVILDDRLERPGVKFKDADLIGFPYRITIGPKALERNCVELLTRSTGCSEEVAVTEVVDRLFSLLTRKENACEDSCCCSGL